MKETMRGWKSVGLALAIMSFVAASYAGYLHGNGNFHIVVSDEAYRSAQLDEDALTHYIASYKIKSILNLQGPNMNAKWYVDELRLSSQVGIVHHDLSISANRMVSDEELSAIVNIMRKTPKPILIHCRSGADRAGLVAALYQYAIAGKAAQEASNQLSILYGHFPFLGNSTVMMDRSFWRYVDVRS